MILRLCIVVLLLTACTRAAMPQSVSPLSTPPGAGQLGTPPTSTVLTGLESLRSRYTLYAPLIQSDACDGNAIARRLVLAFMLNAHQQRMVVRCHPILARAAQLRAEDMRDRLYFAHCSPEGICPNDLLLDLGYPLPYSRGANNVESIAAGFPTPERAFLALTLSPSHRPHVLGEDEFWREQECYGMGYAQRTGGQVPGKINFEHYYVIMTAPC